MEEPCWQMHVDRALVSGKGKLMKELWSLPSDLFSILLISVLFKFILFRMFNDCVLGSFIIFNVYTNEACIFVTKIGLCRNYLIHRL